MWRTSVRRFVPLIHCRALLASTSRASACQQKLQPVPVSGANLIFDRACYSSQASHGEKALSDDVFGIATGLEREELKAELEGKVLFDLEPPRGPFGIKERPAIIDSNFDERIVGCCGGVGEDEHDVLWFKLKKGENYECSVCTQFFQLRVVGPGGPPGGHHHH